MDLADDVAGTAEDAVAHFGFFSEDIVHGGVSPALFSDDGDAVFGGFAALGVAAVGEVVRDAGVGDDDGEVGI